MDVYLKYLWALGILLKSLDILTTNIIINFYGNIDSEANPLINYCMRLLGLNTTYILAFIIFVTATSWAAKRKSIKTIIIIDTLMFAVVINNVVNLFLYKGVT